MAYNSISLTGFVIGLKEIIKRHKLKFVFHVYTKFNIVYNILQHKNTEKYLCSINLILIPSVWQVP